MFERLELPSAEALVKDVTGRLTGRHFPPVSSVMSARVTGGRCVACFAAKRKEDLLTCPALRGSLVIRGASRKLGMKTT